MRHERHKPKTKQAKSPRLPRPSSVRGRSKSEASAAFEIEQQQARLAGWERAILADGRKAWVKSAAAGCRDDPPRAGGSPTRRRGGASAGADCTQALTHSVSVGAPVGAAPAQEQPCAGGTEGGEPEIRQRQSARARSTESGEPEILEREKESARGSEGGEPEILHVRIRRGRVRGPGLAGDEEERVGIGLHIAIVPRALLDGEHEAATVGSGSGGSSVPQQWCVLIKGLLAGTAAAAHGCVLPGER
jgi:hypothetical protein